MSTDREEVRWKFQVLLDSLRHVQEMLDNERKEYQENLYRGVLELKEIRNSFVAGIGSIIGIFLTLISIGSIPKDDTWYTIVGIIAAISVFIGFNIYTSSQYVKYNSLRPKYLQILGDIASLEGLLSTMSLNEVITNEYAQLLTNFIFVIGQVFMYELQHYGHNMIHTMKPIQDVYRESYTYAKENLTAFKNMSLGERYIERIELFIKIFEKNEPKKKSKKP